MPLTECALAPVLQVSDFARALAYYTDVLGLTLEFSFQDSYAGLKAGDASLHLSLKTADAEKQFGPSAVYFFLSSPAEVDSFHTEIVARGAQISFAPANQPYGLRDFSALDPDGNQLSFGGVLEGAEQG